MTLQEYRDAFAEPKQDGSANTEADTRAGRALTAALDTRKFEIDLYWKRATYFWAFIGAAFAGFFAIQSMGGLFEARYLLCCLGLVFSAAWYFVNLGSKCWQRNWELHVDLLEDEIMGPLYKTGINRYSYPF